MAFNSSGIKINNKHFAGSQVSVFMGNVWLDDISSISFELSDNKKPFYGYGSQHFDFVTFGTKIVSGIFTINFREPNYLWLIIERERQLRKSSILAEEGAFGDSAFDSSTFSGDKRTAYNAFFTSSNPQKISQGLQNELNIDNVSSTSARTSSQDNTNHLGVDVIIAYGELTSDTVIQKIVDLHIIGDSKTIEVDGRPVQEQYRFFARDLI